jgi:ABC-type nitrate/sulfonate/bicarbonate transport system substrate-binding protein
MTLTTVTRTQSANAALKDGTVRPEGVELELVEVDPLIKAFRQMVRGRAYDVCELAFTTYLCAKEHGKRFTALPVFLVRGFHHGAIVANGVRDPKDLEGERVGVNRGYTVTTGVWARGVLEEEHGVDLGKVTWVLSGDEHVAEYRPPSNVVPLEPGRELADLLAAGELAAAIGVDGFEPLIPNAAEAGFEALRTRGHYPINHLVVVKDELLGHAPAIFAAFEEAKNRYLESGRLDPLHEQVAAITGSDPLPYGLEPNRATIEELIDHTLRQGILTRKPDVDSLFVHV